MAEDIEQLYKYTDLNGAIKILENKTFKFSTHGQLNDIDDLAQVVHFTSVDHMAFKKIFIEELFNAIKKEKIKLFKHENSKLFYDLINDCRHRIRTSGSKQEKEERIEAINRSLKTLSLAKEYQELNKSIMKDMDFFQSTARIFCTTNKNNYIYMWEKYASEGQGVVFTLNLSKANFPFDKPRKVTYSDTRTALFQSPHEIIRYFLGLRNPDDMQKRIMEETYQCLSTKKTPWVKESEFRFILNCMDKTKLDEYEFQPFPQDFISEIYLGYNMETNAREQIIELLNAFNGIKIFQAELIGANNELKFSAVN